MRIGLAVALLFGLAPAAAQADVAAVSGQAQLALDEEPPPDTSNGAAAGVRLAVQLVFFEGYWDYLNYPDGGSATRVVGGLRGGVDLWRMSFVLRAGLGARSESADDASAAAFDRTGVTARAGAAVETSLGYGLRAGFGLETEAFLVKPRGERLSATNTDFGTGMVGSMYLKLHLGI